MVKAPKPFITWIWTTFFIPFIVWPRCDFAEEISSSADAPPSAYTRSSSPLDRRMHPENDLTDSDRRINPQLMDSDFDSVEPLTATETYEFQPVDTASVDMAENPLEPKRIYSEIHDLLVSEEKLSAEKAASVAKEILFAMQYTRTEGRRIEKELREKAIQEGKSDIDKAFDKKLNKKEIAMIVPGIGEAQVTKNGGVKWIKVVHKESKIAWLFWNGEKIHPDSKDSHLIISNMNFNSGSSLKPEDMPTPEMAKARAKGAVFGRPVGVVIYHERPSDPDGNPIISEVRSYPIPEKGTPRYAYEKKLARGFPFSLHNFLINGTLMGLVQIGMITGLNALTPYIPFVGGPAKEISPVLLAFTFAYSHYAGGWLYPKLRAISPGLTTRQKFWIRALAISVPYAIIYKALIQHTEFAQAAYVGLSVFLPLLAEEAANIGINVYINNRVSSPLQELSVLDKEASVEVQYVRWLEKLGFKVEVADYNGQKRYIVLAFSSRTIDLNNNFRGITIEIPHFSYFLSTAKIGYIFLADAINHYVYRQGQRQNSGRVETYRKIWESSPTARAINSVKAIARYGSGICTEVLSGLSQGIYAKREK